VFHDIPLAFVDRMAYLESIDSRDRVDGTSRLHEKTARRPNMGHPEDAFQASSRLAGSYARLGATTSGQLDG
jgi:hypothetical protein